MFGTIRRHQAWLWVIIAFITIVSFVIYGPTNSKLGNSLKGGGGGFGSVLGRPVGQEAYLNAQHEAALDIFLRSRQFPESGAPEFEMRTWQRLLLIEEQKDFGIQISTEAAAAAAQSILRSLSRSEQGPVSFDDFVDKLLKPAGIDAEDFDRFLHHQLANEQLFRLVGLSGKVVTPQEGEMLYRQQNEDFSTAMVSFPASNYVGAVLVTSDALSQFYSNRVSIYRVPDRVQVSYVKFDVTNYVAAARTALTNLDMEVDEAYKKYGTNLFPEAKTPAEAKAKIRESEIRQRALLDARRAAGEFAQGLDRTEPKDAGNLDGLAKTNGLVTGTTTPFGREDGPAELKVTDKFSQAAFKLTKDEPFAGPIVADDGVYVMALKQQIPSEVPPLASIEAKVAEDYRMLQAMQLAHQAAAKFSNMLTNGLAQGKTFDAICADAGVKPERLPPFSLSTETLSDKVEDRVALRTLKELAFTTPVGKASEPEGSRDGVFVLYVEKRLPVDEAKLKTELPDFLATIRQTRENEVFNGWLSKEFARDPKLVERMQKLAQSAQERAARARAR